MTQAVRSNIDGTTAQKFKIGKRGPTIRQGTDDPNTAKIPGGNGDLYVRIGDTPRLYQFHTDGWTDLTTPTSFARSTATTGAHVIPSSADYVAVNYTGGPCTLILPTGVEGKRIVIKDQSGQASKNNISVQGLNGETIDSKSSVIIGIDFGSITVLYADAAWHII